MTSSSDLSPPQYEITFVRHGQTTANVSEAFIGITDQPLTSEGRQQAHATGKYLAQQEWEFDQIFSSPLIRCAETAQIIADYLSTPILRNSLLIERNYGIFENRTRTEMAQAYPELLADYIANKPFVMLPGGESAVELEKRISAFFWDYLPQTHPNIRSMLVVSHLNPIRAMLRLLGLRDWDIYFEKFLNSSITRIQTDLTQSTLLLYNYSCYEDPSCLRDESSELK